jgi:glycosyltransferase involved in cell wall biosynthesis
VPERSTPAVSVLLPIRNAEGTVAEAVRSVLAQTAADFEIVAVDDGSTDASARIVAGLADEEPRIRPLRPGRVGLVGALSLAAREARAPLLARMDADDLMYPQRLELQREYLEAHPDHALVGTLVEAFPPELVTDGFREYLRWQNAVVEPGEIATNIYVEAPFAHPSVMIRAGVFARIGGYRDGPFPEDYDLWLRLHAAGHRMAKIRRVLHAWRESPGRASRTDPRYARESFDRLRARFLASDARLESGRSIVVWGAGKRTRRRAEHLRAEGVRPDAWIDIDPRKIGRTVWDAPVHPPGWLDRRPRPFVLVYVATHGARDLIAGALHEMGYRPGRDYLPVG